MNKVPNRFKVHHQDIDLKLELIENLSLITAVKNRNNCHPHASSNANNSKADWGLTNLAETILKFVATLCESVYKYHNILQKPKGLAAAF